MRWLHGRWRDLKPLGCGIEVTSSITAANAAALSKRLVAFISADSDQPVASMVWLMMRGVDASACGRSRTAP